MTLQTLRDRHVVFGTALFVAFFGWGPAASRAAAQTGHEGHHDHAAMTATGHEGHGSHGGAPAGHEAHAAKAAPPESLDGLTIPDVSVVDHNGRSVQFYRDLVRGKVVAVNFVFTTCNTICNPQGSNFAELRKLLGAQAGRDVHLVSISIDPETDTPARLKSWSEKFGAGAGWTLITGKKPEVTKLLKALGAYNADRSQHTPILLLGNDATGKWQRSFSLAPPSQIASLLAGLSNGSGTTRGGGR